MNSLYLKASELPGWITKYFKSDLISVDDLLDCIEELDSDLEHLKEEFEDYKENIHDNYKRISPSSQYGVKDD